MAVGKEYDTNGEADQRSLYDTEPVAEADLWFMPGPAVDVAPTDPPWPLAPRDGAVDARDWPDAEAAQYRTLVRAAEAVARFGERQRHAPDGIAGRIALGSVAAVLRGEGVWVSAEQIALHQVLRLASGDAARDLTRAGWALRRLTSGAGGPRDGLREFLGRAAVGAADHLPGADRLAGAEFDMQADRWARMIGEADGLHPLTRAAFGFALWRDAGLTPWDELLEPSVAAMLLGAEGLAPFLPMAPGQRLDRHDLSGGAARAEARIATFLGAAEAGSVAACLEIDRLTAWRDRAAAATGDLSGRTPPALIGALLRYPVLSAELAAETTGCSRPAARRNLNLFARRGLVREVTGQDRYRFWTAAA